MKKYWWEEKISRKEKIRVRGALFAMEISFPHVVGIIE